MKANTQIDRVLRTLRETGVVSRNHFLDLPYDRITRLGAIICNLRNEPYNYDIETEETDRDTLYRLKTPIKYETWLVKDDYGNVVDSIRKEITMKM